MNLVVSNDFKTISLISDDSSANTDHPLVEVYLNGVLTHNLVVSGSTTIGGITYNTTANATNLNFTSTITNTGTKYIHEISSASLSGTADLVLSDGVWSFKFISSAGTTVFHLGVVVHDSLDECIMHRLDPACDGVCSLKTIIDESNKIYGLLYSSKISALKGEFQNAICKYEIATTLCSDCNV